MTQETTRININQSSCVELLVLRNLMSLKERTAE